MMQQQLKLMFNPNECCQLKQAYAHQPMAIDVFPRHHRPKDWTLGVQGAAGLLNEPSADGLLISLNPLFPFSQTLSQDSVLHCRNILIEADVGTMQQQTDWLYATGCPFSLAIGSGNKSVHHILCLTDALPLAEYKVLVERINAGLAPYPFDKQNLSPAKTTKLAGGQRNKSGIKTQELFFAGRRYSLEEVEAWLKLRRVPSAKAKVKVKKDHSAASRLILSYLDEQGIDFPEGRWVNLQCPSCAQSGKDKKRSNLGVCLKDVGLVLKCHAGCEYKEILLVMKETVGVSG